jgi:hypothetical protein
MPVPLVSGEKAQLDELAERADERLAPDAERVAEVGRPAGCSFEGGEHRNGPAMVEESRKS